MDAVGVAVGVGVVAGTSKVSVLVGTASPA